MAGSAFAEGEIRATAEKHFGRARARAGVARLGQTLAVRTRAGFNSKREIELPVSLPLGGVGTLFGCVGSRKSSGQRWLDRSWSGRRIFLWARRSASARERGQRRFCLLCDRR